MCLSIEKIYECWNFLIKTFYHFLVVYNYNVIKLINHLIDINKILQFLFHDLKVYTFNPWKFLHSIPCAIFMYVCMYFGNFQYSAILYSLLLILLVIKIMYLISK